MTELDERTVRTLRDIVRFAAELDEYVV